MHMVAGDSSNVLHSHNSAVGVAASSVGRLPGVCEEEAWLQAVLSKRSLTQQSIQMQVL
jgi:hypothetical protein